MTDQILKGWPEGTIFCNLKICELGPVKIIFDDGSTETHQINELGATKFNYSGQGKPVSIDISGRQYLVDQLPKHICFPNGIETTLSCIKFDEGPLIIMLDVY